jgi:hypothetical protein
VKRLTARSARDLFPGGVFYLAIVILFISLGLVILLHRVWDYDFWWHIATGRYIVTTGHIPHTDPFSFTSQLPENSNLYPFREKFILTQYWLADVLMYLLYHAFGPAGMAALRATLLLGALFIAYKSLKDKGTMPYITFPFIFLAAFSLYRFFGDRPVLFTISLSVACFVMIDDYVRKRSRMFYFLPLLMLVWANLHGGFILGDTIILIFMVIEGAKLVVGRSGFSEKEKVIFFCLLFLSVGASAINPNGFFALLVAFSNEYSPFYVGIQEYSSPFFLYSMKFSPPDYAYLAALFLFPVILILRNRKFNPAHLVLLAALAVESVTAVRFTVYYSMIASLILATELDLWMKEHRERFVIKQAHLNIALSIIMVVSSGLYLWGIADFLGLQHASSFRIRESPWTVPKQAADFIQENHIRGNILNDMGTGGYLEWRLYPQIRTFIDTRALNYTVMREYSWIATARESVHQEHLPPGKIPLWKRLIDHYKINLIVFSPLDYFGNLIPLIPKLLEDKEWVPVSMGIPAIVFAKDVPENRHIIEKFRKTDEQVYNMIIIRAGLSSEMYNKNPHYVEALGDVFVKMGRRDDAITAYGYALKRMPGDPGVKAKLEKLTEEKSRHKNGH